MVLSANDLGIYPSLLPIFCSQCGNRVGWVEDMDVQPISLRCEDCSKIGTYEYIY